MKFKSCKFKFSSSEAKVTVSTRDNNDSESNNIEVSENNTFVSTYKIHECVIVKPFGKANIL